jgi:hypothetical protein
MIEIQTRKKLNDDLLKNIEDNKLHIFKNIESNIMKIHY